MLGMTKAKFKVLDGANKLLNMTAVVGNIGIPCVFNPSEFTVQRNVNYAKHNIPGRDRPVLQFVSGESEVMSLSLVFDTYSAGVGSMQPLVIASTAAPDAAKMDVRTFTDPLMKLSEVNSDTHAPSLIEFVWGSISFKGYIETISQRFTMFNMFGKPVRAVVDMTLVSDKENNLVRNSPDRTKARSLSDGDRLYCFAYAEYGDCSEWRRIAEENNIDNPRRLESGTDIVIPPILD
ncbi:MAG: hypothetical protein MR291_01830 [Oscillospiraceae bacterium]|nr:hypothetical protein [Oscillospiraceae bacterium]